MSLMGLVVIFCVLLSKDVLLQHRVGPTTATNISL